MSIITGRGDSGETDLLFGRRMAKSCTRAESLGCVDELNAALGLARAASDGGERMDEVETIQTKLFGLMGELAYEPEDAARYTAKGYAKITAEDVAWIETLARNIESAGVRFTGWATPGEEGSIGRAALDVARTTARRAERAVWKLHDESNEVPENVRIFLNRLSDFLWILARRGGSALP